MALPVVLGGEEFEFFVKVSDAFVFCCIAEQKTLEENLQFEEKFLPDCGTSGSVPKRISKVTSSTWSMNVQMAVDPANTALDALKTAHRAKTKIEVKMVENRTTVGQSMTGFVYVESMSQSSNAGGFVNCTLSLRGDGDLTIAAVS